MKQLVYLSILLVFFATSCKTDKKQESKSSNESDTANKEQAESTTTAIAKTYLFDAQKSKVLWKAYKPTGSHNGTITLKEGSIDYAESIVNKAHFSIDMSSIVILDMEADDPYNKKLSDHLKAADFFDVGAYPIASFKMEKPAIITEGKAVFSGEITIKGISKPIQFPVSVVVEGNQITLNAEAFQIDRTEFGIQYKSKKFFDNLKDKFINDEFDISFSIVLETE